MIAAMNACTSPVTLKQAWKRAVHQHPDNLALQDDEAGVAMTYQELDNYACRLATHLTTNFHVRDDDVVAICMTRSALMVQAMVGVVCSGQTYLIIDPKYPADRIKFMLEDTNCSVLLTDDSHRGCADDVAKVRVACLESTTLLDSPLAGDSQTDQVAIVQDPNQRAYIVYTSGSTGRPKGIQITHGNILNLAGWWHTEYDVTPSDRSSQMVGAGFDAVSIEVWPYLTAGASVHIVSDETKIDSACLLAWLAEHHITFCFMPTPLVELAFDQHWPDALLTSLRVLLTGGDKLHCGPSTPQLAPLPFRFINVYAPAECTVMTLTHSVQCHEIDPPIGRANRNTVHFVVDRHLAVVPVGVPGELLIGGSQVSLGYLNRPEMTAQKFIPDHLSHQDLKDHWAKGGNLPPRLYRTGDLVRYRSNGELEFLGRIDTQCKIRGQRIELSEIETVLQKQGSVAQAAVIARESPTGKQLVAYISTLPSSEKSSEAECKAHLKTALRNTLPTFMVPAAMVLMKELPLTQNGKIDRKQLAHSAFDWSTQSKDHGNAEVVMPASSTETTIRAAFAKVLHFPDETTLSVTDSFFDLGGHSLGSAQLVSKVTHMCNLKKQLAIATLFEHPSVRALAVVVDTLLGGGKEAEARAIDFETEVAALFPSEIKPRCTPTSEGTGAIASVLLTGATGYLGAFLLHELLQKLPGKVYCLVRAENKEAGHQRLQSTLEKYNLRVSANESQRIEALTGDLGLPRLGLSAAEFVSLGTEIDAIYHCGCLVNFMTPYEKLRAPNCGSVAEVLRLAAMGETTTPIHHISSLSVYGEGPQFSDSSLPLKEDADLPSASEMCDAGGYSQTKWIAERMFEVAREQYGMPIAIHRPGRILGDTRSGEWNTADFMHRVLRGCAELGAYPSDCNWCEIGSPVNFVATAIVQISTGSSAANFSSSNFNLVHADKIHFSALFKFMVEDGYNMEACPYKEWTRRLQSSSLEEKRPSNPIFPLLPVICDMGRDHSMPAFECTNTITALEGSQTTCPPMDQALLHKFMSISATRG